jgi:hypothetical protein
MIYAEMKLMVSFFPIGWQIFLADYSFSCSPIWRNRGKCTQQVFKFLGDFPKFLGTL